GCASRHRPKKPATSPARSAGWPPASIERRKRATAAPFLSLLPTSDNPHSAFRIPHFLSYAPPGEHDLDRFCHDPHVQPEGVVINVRQVVLELVLRRGVVFSIDLGQTSQPRLHLQPFRVA